VAYIQLEISDELLAKWDEKAKQLREKLGRKKPPTLYEWVTSDPEGLSAVRLVRSDKRFVQLPIDEVNKWLKQQHRKATGYGQRTGRPKVNEYRLLVLAEFLGLGGENAE